MRIAGEAFVHVSATPSDHVTFHGPNPVKSAWIVEAYWLVPLTVMLVFPETNAVGRGLTVTEAVPTKSPGWLPIHVSLLETLVTVNV